MQNDQPNLTTEQIIQQNDHSGNAPDSGEKAQGRWDDDQHFRFLQGLFKFGKNWKQIQILVGTRICSQVRSHAQKYFIKLQKIIKDRKKQKNRLSLELTQIQKEILQRFTLDDVTEKTPQILVSLLQNACLVPSSKNMEKAKVITHQQNQEEQKILKREVKNKYENFQQADTLSKNKQMQTKKVYTSDQKKQQSQNGSQIHDQYQQKSFFCQWMQHNVQHLRKGKDFIDFIDLIGKHNEQIAHNKQQELQSSQTTRNRRASFTLVQDQQNDQRLKQAIQKIKKGERSQR